MSDQQVPPKAMFNGVPYDGTPATFQRLLANTLRPPVSSLSYPSLTDGSSLMGPIHGFSSFLPNQPADVSQMQLHPLFPPTQPQDINSLMPAEPQFNQARQDQLFNTMQQSAQDVARLTPPPAALQMPQFAGQQAGAQAGLGLLQANPIDPNQIRYTGGPNFAPKPYSPTALPEHTLPTIPDRPVVSNDPASSILGGIAGLFDPRAAGHYAAAPLEAAHNYAAQAYQDALNRFNMASSQADIAYKDRLAQAQQANQYMGLNTQQANQGQLLNQGRALTGNEALGAAQNQRLLTTLGPTEAGASAGAELGALAPIAGQETAAAQAAVPGHIAGMQQQALLEQYKLAIDMYGKEYGVYGKMGAANLLAQGRVSVAQIMAAAKEHQIAAYNNRTGEYANKDLMRNQIDQGYLALDSMPDQQVGKLTPQAQGALRFALQADHAFQAYRKLLQEQYKTDSRGDGMAVDEYMDTNPEFVQLRGERAKALNEYQQFAGAGNPNSPNTTGNTDGRTMGSTQANPTNNGNSGGRAPSAPPPKPKAQGKVPTFNTTTGKFE